MLAAIVDSDQVRIQSSDASFGYFSPLSLSGLKIESDNETAKISVERIEADHSWLGLLLARPDLGEFRFVEPTVDVLIDEATGQVNTERDGDDTADTTAPAQKTPKDEQGVVTETAKTNPNVVELPNVAATFRGARFILRTSPKGEPPVDFTMEDVTVQLVRDESRGGSSLLKMEQAPIYKRQKLTPELCEGGLQLVAPLLADEVSAEGEFSLTVEALELDFAKLGGDEPPVVLNGSVAFHQLDITIKNTATQQLLGLIAEVLDSPLPESLAIAEEIEFRFEVDDGRIRHEGFAMVLPHEDSSIRITSSGSVGLDESLDLNVSIEFPPGKLGDSVLANTLVGEPIRLAVTGTVDEPQIGLAEDVKWISAIAGMLSDDEEEDADLEAGLVGLVSGLLDVPDLSNPTPPTERPSDDPASPRARKPLLNLDRPTDNEPLFPRLRERLRQRRQTNEPTSL